MSPYDDGLNMQRAIQVDFVYDHLMFCVKKGFPWKQVCAIVNFARQFLEAVTGRHISEAVVLYQQDITKLQQLVNERNIKMYSDFVFSTFFTHFQLYKFVLTNPRQVIAHNKSLLVYPPVPPHPLAEAKELSIWTYESKISELEKKQDKIQLNRRAEKEELRREAERIKVENKTKLTAMESPLSKETLRQMLKNVMAEYTAATAAVISSDIARMKEDLEIKLEMRSVPRPRSLGPMPCFSLKSKISSTLLGFGHRNARDPSSGKR
ncbi:uncharacterized protein C8orf74 homolog isoform X2 [Pomacea canaliculata]|nr:uncharacterized protein C8orf74 homolog isoform X2 [Pomacea canaliculata]XP_025110567.1 uncharacterized protein C8orf74 homolog isoform X2 [Pomacea canaliculata]XP_025110568.1 uncharacterized protein C8orf74 homolog isoform X2 [Pomacea canaliculata]XP_025110569.1 uncharacterized protein C8orf74 homolog isoform X2 [Pomacea canaliculata]XP_025110570.1 uncharacterized protein C8orf74 homolog isoform X2 [Pomacea canaliculata]